MEAQLQINRVVNAANIARTVADAKAGRVKVGPKRPALKFYGNNLKMLESTEHQLMLAGPAETGKTYVCCEKLHRLCKKYPKTQAAIVRKSYTDMPGTVLQTFARIAGNEVKVYGGEKPQWYDYPNGSRVWVGGMDHPGKVLSSERDFIYCFVGETIVDSPSPIINAYQREYSGPLVTIRTANGNRITGTPNHPILTDQGWIALGLLKVGSNVVSRSLGQEMPARYPNIENRPSTIADVFRALSQSGARGTTTERIAGIDMDFHGDGEQGDINIVTTNGPLGRYGYTSLPQPVRQHQIDRACLDLPVLKGLSADGQIFLSTRLALAALGGNIGESLAPLGITAAPIMSRFTASQGRQFAPEQFGFDNAVAGTDGRRNGDHPAFPFQVSLDSVVHVSVTDSSIALKTQVYNLHTEDNYFVAGNIIAHNCNQAEEFSLDDWEILTTRVTGRAGNVSMPQVIGDCNPGMPTHWIKTGGVTVIESRHEDNPRLFDQAAGKITPQGELSLSILDRLTGPRKARLRYGQWAGAEGMVYEDSWDAKRNLIDRFEIPQDWRRYWVIDFGFTNPFCWQAWAEDPDGRLYRYREIYHTQRLVEDHAKQIIAVTVNDPRPDVIICDHDAEGRATFEKYSGLTTTAAQKEVLEGIQAVASRLRSNGDGKARLFLLRDSLVERDQSLRDKHKPTCTEEEVEGYIWKESAKKEEPLKENDHGCDAARYMAAFLDFPQGGFAVHSFSL